MGDFTFNPGNLNTVMLTVLKSTGAAAVYPDDYSEPTVTITHIEDSTEVVDVDAESMVQLGSTNRWYYNHVIPNDAPAARYVVTFNTVLEGVSVIATEEFRVVPVLLGSGEFEIDILLENATTHLPLQGATVNIYDKNNATMLIATSQTDPDGYATCFLSAGTYLAEFKKTGVISEVHTLVVDSLGNYTLDGD